MAKIKFDAPGKHYFETGVSNGVLFVKDANSGTYGKGVAWNGLSSVSESPEGAEETAIYADNIKYLSLRSLEEFKGTIEAYTYPDEFEACDGSKQFGAPGVKASQQARSPFCFSYQTKKGSDENPDLGYIIHIIYGATAAPSEKSYETVNDSPEAITFSWEISTTPIKVDGFGNGISHIEIDSTKLDAAKLKEIEDALYGTDSEEPHILMPDELLEILQGEKKVLSIEAALAVSGKTYSVDESIDKVDFVITAVYDDGTKEAISDYECNVELPYTFVSGDVTDGKDFKFTYKDLEANLNVKVTE